VLRTKIYIVTSPSLISAIDRRSKSISFAPYVVQFAKRILDPSRRALDALADDLGQENGAVGLRPETLKAMHDSLAPGEHLEATTQMMLKSVSDQLSSLDGIGTDEEIELFDWVRHIVTRASTDAIYGTEKNPFQDPAISHGFWFVSRVYTAVEGS